jgi:NAD(P)-dependent dehydrogenase (short-subunit alcohol dehydrogenase family)
MKNNFDLSGKYSLITGAGGLLGLQHALALAEINSNLVLTDIDYKKLKAIKKEVSIKYSEINIITYRMDVSKEAQIKKILKVLLKKRINIDVLINNAAIDSKVKSNQKMTNSSKFENITLKEWHSHLSVGLTGAMLCSKIFGTNMAQNNIGGVILNIASDLSVIAPNHKIYKKGVFKPIMYSVLKHGLIGMTKYLSTYWNKKGIRCNALSPGPVQNNQAKSFITKLKKEIPLNRLAKENEYKAAIQFLCSDASSYMTGQNLIIDGGRSVW